MEACKSHFTARPLLLWLLCHVYKQDKERRLTEGTEKDGQELESGGTSSQPSHSIPLSLPPCPALCSPLPAFLSSRESQMMQDLAGQRLLVKREQPWRVVSDPACAAPWGQIPKEPPAFCTSGAAPSARSHGFRFICTLSYI